jgi:hypothetical protein
MKNISSFEKDRYHDMDELHANIKQLSEIIVCLHLLLEIEKDKEGCVSIKKLLTFCTLKDKILDELRLAAIRINNIEYALFLFDEHGPIGLSLIQEAIDYNKLECLLKIIRKQIIRNIITPDHLENILELILNNKKASVVAEAIMVEFPRLISENFLIKNYCIKKNFELFNYLRLSTSKEPRRCFSTVISEHESIGDKKHKFIPN